jgi:hypothetical protein
MGCYKRLSLQEREDIERREGTPRAPAKAGGRSSGVSPLSGKG